MENLEGLHAAELRCEYLENPLGIQSREPRLSWQLVSERRNQRQSAYQILVASAPEILEQDCGDLWDTGKVECGNSLHIRYAGQPLQSGQRCYWKVRVWDGSGSVSAYSFSQFWSVGLLDESDWLGQWITVDTGESGEMEMKPSPYLRREFALKKPIRQAMLYATARGLYNLYLNGQRVGDITLAPDWTDYHKRFLYQTYDVTDALQTGNNALAVMLGDGWYCGYVGNKLGRNYYGTRPSFLMQLQVEYADGSAATIVTDGAWKGAAGAIIHSDLLMGETYDARLEMPGWDKPGFDDSSWSAVSIETAVPVKLEGQNTPPTRIVQHLPALELKSISPTTHIFDLGQNIAGWVRLKVSGAAGTHVRLRYGEDLTPEDMLYTGNLRTARVIDVYILKGEGVETWEPHFTIHGFRYVEIDGIENVSLDTITGCVIHSDLVVTGKFECSDPMLNQLWRNIFWGQRGNFVSIPTDCPQRDERLGWAGDVVAFGTTACYNMDSAAFLYRWMDSMVDGQSAEGAFPDVAPRLVMDRDGAPAWGDAGVITPWTLYQFYGDKSIIERYYEPMQKWMLYIYDGNPNYLRTERLNMSYGDWLSYNAPTPSDVLATAFWAWDAKLISRMARIIGHEDEAVRYEALYERIRQAFIAAYVSADGRVQGETQTVYLLALHVDLLPPDLREAAVQHLVADIQARDNHLSTGFVGTPLLLPVLADVGYVDLAYTLLLQDTIPSWGYMVKLGATTVWERWDSLSAPRVVFDPETPTFIHWHFGVIAGMNSFNHYGLGAVGEWLYHTILGVKPDAETPAFEHFTIQPRPSHHLTSANGEYHSIRGTIRSSWCLTDDEFQLHVTIPSNTTATVYVPASTPDSVFENGSPAAHAEGVQSARFENETLVCTIGSGEYHFTSRKD